MLELLRRYKPQDTRDKIQKEIIEQFVRDTPDCFERTQLKGHITGSAWVVDESGDRVLLTNHIKLGKWLQLGGHSDGNPDTREVALREAREESGLQDLEAGVEIFDVDVHSIPEREGEPAHLHYDIRFLIRANGNAPLRISRESRELAWIPLADLSKFSNEESLHRMARKWSQSR